MWQSCFKTVKFPMQHTHKKTGCEPRRDAANVRFTPRASIYHSFLILRLPQSPHDHLHLRLEEKLAVYKQQTSKNKKYPQNANYSMLNFNLSLHIFVKKHTMSSNSILEIFGRNVQKYRKEQHLSQEKLAEYAGLHRTYIGMIERAEKNITLVNIEKIAKALNINLTKLLENNE